VALDQLKGGVTLTDIQETNRTMVNSWSNVDGQDTTKYQNYQFLMKSADTHLLCITADSGTLRCISYSSAYLKYLNKYVLTANLSAYVKYVNTFACQIYLHKIVLLCIFVSACHK
jgi:hypothetical protein